MHTHDAPQVPLSVGLCTNIVPVIFHGGKQMAHVPHTELSQARPIGVVVYMGYAPKGMQTIHLVVTDAKRNAMRKQASVHCRAKLNATAVCHPFGRCIDRLVQRLQPGTACRSLCNEIIVSRQSGRPTLVSVMLSPLG